MLDATPGWTTIRRETSLVEHICEHGTGHPNYYSYRRLDLHYGHEKGTWSIHGCDGCCLHSDFPGRKLTDDEILDRLERQFLAFRSGEGSVVEMTKWIIFNGHDLSINITDALEEEFPDTVPPDWQQP